MIWHAVFYTTLKIALQDSAVSVNRLKANLAVNLLPVFEKDDSRDAHNAKLFGKALFLVDVYLGDDRLAFKFIGERFNHGREHFTRAAPGSPKVNDYKLVFTYHGIEIRFRGMHNIIRHNKSSLFLFLIVSAFLPFMIAVSRRSL